MNRQKVLIVDDLRENLVAMEKVFEKIDCDVTLVQSGNDALTETLNNDFAVAILDVMMPEMTGFELAEHLRSDPRTKTVPIIFVTARSADEEHLFEGYSAGAVDYIVKPFNPHTLISKVKVFLELDAVREDLRQHRNELERIVDLRTAELRQKNEKLREYSRNLLELLKEMRCITAVSDIVSRPSTPLGEALHLVAEAVPKGCEYPGATSARITYDHEKYESRDFSGGVKKHHHYLVVEGVKRGSLEVFVRANSVEHSATIFTNEEKSMLDEIVRKVAERIERDLMTKALVESEARYKVLFGDSPAGIVTFDALTKVIKFANPTIHEILGFGSDDIEGMNIVDIPYVESEQTDFTQAQESLWNGTSKSPMIVPCRRLDGSVRYAMVQTSKIRFGAEESVVAFFTDITERMTLEDALRQSQKLEAIGQLAGGIAHDFNNIIQAQLGYCEMMLENESLDDQLSADLHELHGTAERAARLTRQLLAFSRKQTLKLQVLNVNDVVENIQRMLQRLIGEDIELRVEIEDRLGLVMADVGQIEQAILNLAVNARDAMPDGGILTIETSCRDVEPGCPEVFLGIEKGRFVTLKISDTGSGMSQETKRRIFEPFFTTKGENRGTGLGLSTVYGIVKQLGGSISVESELGSGTSISISLPETTSKEEPVKISKRPATSDATPATSKQVIVVEDEPALREVLSRIVEWMNMKVLLASNGDEALMLLENCKPDLVITDVVMPGMSGFTLADRVHEKYPNVPVLFMSGYTDRSFKKSERVEHDFQFIQKPFNIHDIKEKIESLVEV
ncbi:MAG: response regulator [Planctomycetes bacterium]|nr:response regulator [Planctomycetota bacterium]